METSSTINKVLVIGWDLFADRVAHELLTADLTVKVVVNDSLQAQQIEATYGKRLSVVISDFFDFRKMESAGIDKAQVVLVNLAGDQEKLIYVINLRKRFPNVKIVAPVTNPRLNESFVTAAEVLPLSKEEVSAKIFASYLFERDVADYLNDLLSPAQKDADHDIQQQLLRSGNPYCGKQYGDVFVELKTNYNAVLIGMSRPSSDGYQLHKNPPEATVLQENDYLIVVVDGPVARRLKQEIFGSDES